MIQFITGFFILTWGGLISLILFGALAYPEITAVILGFIGLSYVIGWAWMKLTKSSFMDWI